MFREAGREDASSHLPWPLVGTARCGGGGADQILPGAKDL